jgi:hypothetical protein
MRGRPCFRPTTGLRAGPAPLTLVPFGGCLLTMLSDSSRAHLLHSVPSFVPKWEERCADQAEYEARFPEARWNAEEYSHEFRTQLAWHLGERVAEGELHEVEWFFAALEALYQVADDDLDSELTVGLLEDLIHSVEMEGAADASILHAIPKGPLTREAWEAAYAYTRHGRP